MEKKNCQGLHHQLTFTACRGESVVHQINPRDLRSSTCRAQNLHKEYMCFVVMMFFISMWNCQSILQQRFPIFFASSACGEPPFCFTTLLPAVGTLGIGFLWFHHEISHSFWLTLAEILDASEMLVHNVKTKATICRHRPRCHCNLHPKNAQTTTTQKIRGNNPPSETSKQQPNFNKNTRTVTPCQTHSKR